MNKNLDEELFDFFLWVCLHTGLFKTGILKSKQRSSFFLKIAAFFIPIHFKLGLVTRKHMKNDINKMYIQKGAIQQIMGLLYNM